MAEDDAMVGKRPYDVDDVRVLLEHVAAWASGWDDVLLYLRTEAPHEGHLGAKEVEWLTKDIERLRDGGVAYTRDYRAVWHELKGEDVSHLPLPVPPKEPVTNPAELAGCLEDVDFPARRSVVFDAARKKGAPQRVLDLLGAIKDKRYSDLGDLIEAVAHKSWDLDMQAQWGEFTDPADMVEDIAARADVDRGQAEAAFRTVLSVLGEQISRGQAQRTADQLPDQFGVEMRRTKPSANPVSLEDFYRQVAERRDVSEEQARAEARAVGNVLERAVPNEQLECVRAELSEDYAELFP